MKKTLLILFIFLFGGCSLDQVMLWTGLNRVAVVKQTPYMKQYRVYFERNGLKPVRHGKRYLFFYNRKSKDLAILFHPAGSYKLYNITHPSLLPTIVRSDRKHGYRTMLRTLRKKGFRPANPSQYGFFASVSLRRHKGVKTYRVDIKDYRRLIAVYKHAIRTYDAGKIRRVRAKLPLSLIQNYYTRYQSKASSAKQKQQLHIIGTKLGLYRQTTTSKKEESHITETKTEEIPVVQTEAEIPAVQTEEEAKPKDLYSYYLHTASFYELQNYLSTSSARNQLTYQQYNTLKAHYNYMKEEKLLREGSLEELIAAYKKNNDPKYKAKILTRIKALQQHN
jgi:hypothetical protein